MRKSAVSVKVSARLMARDSSLWRSRGTKKTPGAVSGGIIMAPPRMDWPDAARMEIPRGGKGLKNDQYEGEGATAFSNTKQYHPLFI